MFRAWQHLRGVTRGGSVLNYSPVVVASSVDVSKSRRAVGREISHHVRLIYSRMRCFTLGLSCGGACLSETVSRLRGKGALAACGAAQAIEHEHPSIFFISTHHLTTYIAEALMFFFSRRDVINAKKKHGLDELYTELVLLCCID